MRIRSVFSHTAQALAEGALIALIVVGLVAGSALAARGGGSAGGKGGGGKPSGGGTATISLAPLVDDKNGNGTPNWGDVVTFNVSTTATTQPWVNLVCKQNGVVVSQSWDGYFEGSLTTRNFSLYSPQWSSGAADCVAYVTNPSWSRLGSTSFHVDG